MIGLGCAGFILVLLALSWLRIWPSALSLDRTCEPPTVFVGDDFAVRLSVTNMRRSTSAPVTLIDPINQPLQATRTARTAFDALAPGESCEVRYRFTAQRRGQVQLGPLWCESSDPCGLACRQVKVFPRTTALVLPRVDEIRAPNVFFGDNLDSGYSHAWQRGAEFSSLRPYVPGDETRSIHWPSSAKTDSLMVRVDDQLVERRCTVLLDVRTSIYSDTTFERAVSAAASILAATQANGASVSLALSNGTNSPHGATADHLHTLLKMLAVVETVDDLTFNQGTTNEPLVIITADPEPLPVFIAHSHSQTVVFLNSSMVDHVAPRSTLHTTVTIAAEQQFVAVWDTAQQPVSAQKIRVTTKVAP